MRSPRNGRLDTTRAALELTCLLTSLHRLTPLSRHQSRCVDGHEQRWFDRFAPLALRTVQPMRSPLTRAHPSQPSASLLCRLAPGSGFRHCDGYHTRRRSPPAGLATNRGRGSNPRGGTAAWSQPRLRGVPHGLTEGDLLPLAPSGGAAAFPRPSRPASHIHNHPSACPAQIYLPPIVTTSHSALLARW